MILKEKINSMIKKESFAAGCFMLPSVVGILVLYLLPFIDTFRRSFFNTRGTKLIMLESYKSVLKNEAFKLAFFNTFKFIIICIPILIIVSFTISLMVRAASQYSPIFKALYLLPMAIPVASIALLWKVLFHSKGLLNSVLINFNFTPIEFMFGNSIFFVLVGTYLLKNSGYNMVIWLAGLDSISHNLYEAAKVDGAGPYKSFVYITLPCVMPTLGVVGVLSLLNSFKVFREAYLVAGAYPSDSIYLLQHLFNNWFQNMDISRLCSAAVLLCVPLLLFALLFVRLMDKKEE